MKKTALVLLLLLCTCAPANAADFVQIAANKYNAIYLDINSVQERDGYILAWTKWVYSDAARQLKNHNKKTVSSLRLYACRKDCRQSQYLSYIDYDKNGNTVETKTTGFDRRRYEEIVPGSVGEMLYDSVMEVYYARTRPEAKTYSSMADLVGAYLGITFAEDKTEGGYFLVCAVTQGGISEFAGFKVGDIFTKIDTYDLKEHEIERVASYISLRYGQRAIIKATVSRQGVKKVIAIQL